MSCASSVLVIDDNADALSVLASLVSALGAEQVRQASSAEQALELLAAEKFKLVISDYRLGGMDGVAMLEHLRARGDQTPVLFVSGAPDRSAVERASRHSRVDFFGKPFRLADLLGAMERLVGP
jgi:DNA-binding NtrC family response regulator